MKKNDKKVTHKRKAPVRGIDPLRAGAAKGAKDYAYNLPEMSVEKISKLCWTLQRGINQDAQAQLEEIVRRCNQFIPQVMRYMRLLDQFDREVIQPEIAAKKASRKDARAQNGLDARKIAKLVCDGFFRCPINEAGAECDCCVGRGKNCPLERSIKLFNDESGAKVGRK